MKNSFTSGCCDAKLKMASEISYPVGKTEVGAGRGGGNVCWDALLVRMRDEARTPRSRSSKVKFSLCLGWDANGDLFLHLERTLWSELKRVININSRRDTRASELKEKKPIRKESCRRLTLWQKLPEPRHLVDNPGLRRRGGWRDRKWGWLEDNSLGESKGTWVATPNSWNLLPHTIAMQILS